MGVRILPARLDHAPAVVQVQFDCYPRLAQVNAWREDQVRAQIRNFPGGQFAAEVDGTVVGYCANLIVRERDALRAHTYNGITSDGTFERHDSEGDTLYGAEIMVHPSQRRKGIGSGFYRARFDLVRERRLRRFVSGGRFPGYADHRSRLSPEQYVEAVLAGRLEDRTLSMQLRAGLRVSGVLRNYLRDPSSADCATLLVWDNPDLQAGPTPDVPPPPPPPTPSPLTPEPAPGDFSGRAREDASSSFPA